MPPSQSFQDQLSAMLPRLRRFAHGLCRNAADADDLVQATVERALRSHDQWQDGTRLDSWLFRIQRNIWIDLGRAGARRARYEAPPEDGFSVGEDPRPGIEAGIDLQRAMAALQRLPEEQREIVSLILIEGLGYRETAEILDLPIGTVSSRLVRGRTALAHMLGGGGHDD